MMAPELQQLPLEALQGRRFSFYPAIRGIEHNEWSLEDSTWSEVQVRNCQSGQEFWVSKSHLGNVSSSDSPVLILGLHRELEAKAGGVYPYRKVVTEMPSTAASRTRATPAGVAPPPKAHAHRRSDARMLRLLGLAVGAALIVGVLGFSVIVGGLHNPLERLFQPDTSTTDQRYLGLATNDSYFEVVSKLSRPESELWMSDEEDELQFQALQYPSRRYTVIMMGGSRAEMRYIGTLHEPSRVVLDSARLVRGGDTSSMMRNLPAF